MSSPFLGSDSVGRTIDGRFKLLRRLGGTEQSSVFLTELKGDPPRKAAIKLSPANAVDAKTRLARWEADKTLSHPNLMGLFHTGRCQLYGVELLYVVTEYADEVLSEILRERSLTPAETREMLGPLVDALSWLHDRKLLHGHLKPSNIMVVDEQLKLSTDRLHAMGEPGWASSSSGKYDAPEATLMTMSPAADVWSLGMVVVESLTRRLPRWDGFGGADPVVPSSLPQPFSAIARECLRVDSTLRCTLSGIRDSLNASRAAQPARKASAFKVPAFKFPAFKIPAFKVPAFLSSLARPSKTSVTIAAAVLVVGVLIAALVIGSHHPPSPPAVSRSSAPQPSAPQPSAAQPPSSAPKAQPRHGSAVKGAVAYRALPDVPQHISETIQGRIRVIIRVEAGPDGNVSNASIDSPGPSRYFANQALQAARNWKFTPPQVDGRAVASTWTLHFWFGRTDITVTPAETSP